MFHLLSVVKKLAQYMTDVLEDSRDKVQENLLANGGKCLPSYDKYYTVLIMPLNTTTIT